ncbi:hypothetical protein CEXT_776311 [Caerostris extrusa]|uniref:Uncharacterized protein n=1 Tax=Caerostris extrusa TaxID=172846 RepID=A0AAV4NG00_CAEEX|nr:hypothetical protein CEXT_776311 [Caerostris extrusa]
MWSKASKSLTFWQASTTTFKYSHCICIPVAVLRTSLLERTDSPQCREVTNNGLDITRQTHTVIITVNIDIIRCPSKSLDKGNLSYLFR